MAETLHMKIDRERKRKLAKMAAAKRLPMSVVIRDLIDDAPEPRAERRVPKVRA